MKVQALLAASGGLLEWNTTWKIVLIVVNAVALTIALAALIYIFAAKRKLKMTAAQKEDTAVPLPSKPVSVLPLPAAQAPADEPICTDEKPASVDESVCGDEEPGHEVVTLCGDEESAADSEPSCNDEEIASAAETEEEEEDEKEDEEEDSPAVFDESEEDEAEHEVVVLGGRKVYYRYNFSFRAKLIQAPVEIQQRYGAIADEIRACPKLKTNLSWRQMRVYCGRQTLAYILFRGRKLCMAFALDPAVYAETKYRGIDLTSVKRFGKTPMLIKLTSKRRTNYAKYLLGEVLKKYGLEKGETKHTDFSLPYKSREELILCGLVKIMADEKFSNDTQAVKADISDLIREKITLKEARIVLTNEAAASLIEAAEEDVIIADVSPSEHTEEKHAGSRKKGIVNIDALSCCFEPGERVTLQKMKEKGLVPKNVRSVKVLARGILSKPLVVEAQDFSIDAVKMIVLTGGRAIKKA